jgi:hypothetical protein
MMTTVLPTPAPPNAPIFAALEERADQVNDLDAGLEHFLVSALLVKQRRGPVNGHARLFADGAEIVHRLADDVNHAAQRLFAHGHADGGAQVDGLHAANHAVCGLHRNRAHASLAQVLLHFENHADGRGNLEALAGDAQRLIDGRHRCFFKLHVHRGTGDLDYLADILCHCKFSALSKAMNLAYEFLFWSLFKQTINDVAQGRKLFESCLDHRYTHTSHNLCHHTRRSS